VHHSFYFFFLLFCTVSVVIECFLGCLFVFCEIGRPLEPKSEIGQVVRSQIFGRETSDLTKNEIIRVHRPRKCRNKPCPISGKKSETSSEFKKMRKKRRNWNTKRKLVHSMMSKLNRNEQNFV